MDFSWHRRANACIAQGYLTNSKRPETFVKGQYPTHLARAQGAYVFDHRGNKYLDFFGALGTNILGYANDRVNEAMRRAMAGGYSHSLATHHEVEAAEKIKEIFPAIDAVKFLKSGSDACSAAVKIARTATGRTQVISDGYHGMDDLFVSLTPPALGIPRTDFHISKLEGKPFDFRDVACVIVEPVITDMSEARIRWLQALREACTADGAMLVFDEVITGFRLPKFSVAGHTGITPDLLVMGKAMANGMPLAAVGGKYDVMNQDYFISSTYAGEILSLAAGLETMTLLQTKYLLSDLWEHGAKFVADFNSMGAGLVWLDGYPTRGVFKARDELTKALFWQECCRAGMLWGPSWFFNFPLIAEYPSALIAMKSIVTRIKNGEVKLEGEMPRAPVAQKMREEVRA